MRLGTGDTPVDAAEIENITKAGRIAWHKPANEDEVKAVLAMDPDPPDGETRSEWLWIRLANGDLILGVYPQDNGYFMHEESYP